MNKKKKAIRVMLVRLRFGGETPMENGSILHQIWHNGGGCFTALHTAVRSWLFFRRWLFVSVKNSSHEKQALFQRVLLYAIHVLLVLQ